MDHDVVKAKASFLTPTTEAFFGGLFWKIFPEAFLISDYTGLTDTTKLHFVEMLTHILFDRHYGLL